CHTHQDNNDAKDKQLFDDCRQRASVKPDTLAGVCPRGNNGPVEKGPAALLGGRSLVRRTNLYASALTYPPCLASGTFLNRPTRHRDTDAIWRATRASAF